MYRAPVICCSQSGFPWLSHNNRVNEYHLFYYTTGHMDDNTHNRSSSSSCRIETKTRRCLKWRLPSFVCWSRGLVKREWLKGRTVGRNSGEGIVIRSPHISDLESKHLGSGFQTSVLWSLHISTTGRDLSQSLDESSSEPNVSWWKCRAGGRVRTAREVCPPQIVLLYSQGAAHGAK